MSEMKTLSVQKREALGKGPNRRLRVEALVPGVYYAPDGTNIIVQMPLNPLNKVYSQVGRTNVFNLEIEADGVKTEYPVFIWDAQYHHIKGQFIHLDFYGVELDKEIDIKVRLKFVGTAKGVKIGGKMDVFREEVILRAKPQAMPRIVEVDTTDFELGTNLRASDLVLPEGVSIVYKNNYSILSVTTNDKSLEEEAEAAKK